MKIASMLLAGALAVPAAAGSSLPQGWGSCDYNSEESEKRGLTYCTHVQDEARCVTVATAKSSKEWTATHPPKFTRSARCDDKNTTARAKKTDKGKTSGGTTSSKPSNP